MGHSIVPKQTMVLHLATKKQLFLIKEALSQFTTEVVSRPKTMLFFKPFTKPYNGFPLVLNESGSFFSVFLYCSNGTC